MVKIEGQVLAKVNFPLYTIHMVTSHHILVGGGGGSAKTGVANGFELLDLSHDGKQYYIEDRVRHETGDNVVMNSDVHSSGKSIYIVAGQENSNQMYKIHVEIKSGASNGKYEAPDKNNTNESTVRKRKDVKKEAPVQNGTSERKIRFNFKEFDSIQTVFTGTESLQRVVRLNRMGSMMVTGGTDGQLKLWSFPKMKQLVHIEAHSKEVDDADFSIAGDQIISVAKDGHAFVWNCKNGALLKELKWQTPENKKYLFKRCRYGLVEDNKKLNRLFTIANPVVQTKKSISFLHQWDVEKGCVSRSREMTENLAALAVRDDGRHVAVGTMFTGSVYVFIAFSLQQILYVPKAHNMFVTGLEFLPVLSKAYDTSVSSISEAAVLSISVDNKVCLHTVPHRCTVSIKVALLLVFIVLILTFIAMSMLGL